MTEPTPESGDSITANRDDIARAAADVRTDPRVGERASAAIGRHLWPEEQLQGGLVEREFLVELYARRLKRSAQLRNPPIGLSELVQSLGDRADVRRIRLFVAARNGAVISLFSDPDVDWLLGCVVSEPTSTAERESAPEPGPTGASAD